MGIGMRKGQAERLSHHTENVLRQIDCQWNYGDALSNSRKVNEPEELSRWIKADTQFVFKINSRFLQPFCLGLLLNYFSQSPEHQTITLEAAYGYATGIVLSTALILCSYNLFVFFAVNLSCKTRVACSGLIYRKSLKIMKASAEEGQNGKIINILANDLSRFDDAFIAFPDLFGGPILTVLFLVAIYMEIGVAGIIGVACLFAFAPVQGMDYIYL